MYIMFFSWGVANGYLENTFCKANITSEGGIHQTRDYKPIQMTPTGLRAGILWATTRKSRLILQYALLTIAPSHSFFPVSLILLLETRQIKTSQYINILRQTNIPCTPQT